MNHSIPNEAVHQPRPASGNNERSLRAIVAEIAEELREFVDTRIQMFKNEATETLGALKIAAPLGVVAAGLFLIGLLMITLACVAIVASAFAGNPYAWFYAFIIIGACWLILASVAAFFVVNEFRGRGRFPKRTIDVLKADKVWLQREAKGQL